MEVLVLGHSWMLDFAGRKILLPSQLWLLKSPRGGWHSPGTAAGLEQRGEGATITFLMESAPWTPIKREIRVQRFSPF